MAVREIYGADQFICLRVLEVADWDERVPPTKVLSRQSPSSRYADVCFVCC